MTLYIPSHLICVLTHAKKLLTKIHKSIKVIDGERYSPLIIVSCSLVSCAILWLLVLQYAIRLGINNDIKLIVIILVCIDAILEFGAAVMLIIANLYCTEIIYLPIMFGFSYSNYSIGFLP